MANAQKLPSKKEQRFLIAVFALFIALEILALISFFVGLIWSMDQTNPWDSIFETVYMVIHIVILGMALYLSGHALKRGSYIIKQLMFGGHRKVSRVAMGVAIALSVFGYGLALYFILVYFGVAPIPSYFGTMLVLCLINSPLTLGVGATFFWVYPLLFTAKDGQEEF